MSIEPSLLLLFDEFPELQSPEVLLEKEVLAHFGLLFSGYALLETGLQNCYIFWKLRLLQIEGMISDQKNWEIQYNHLEKKAHASTFGNLLNLVSDCPLLSDHLKELRVLKGKRDYFAHHFFREENDKMYSRDATLRLIGAMNALRRRVKVAEGRIDEVALSIVSAVYPGLDIPAALSKLCSDLKVDAIKSPKNSFGWE